MAMIGAATPRPTVPDSSTLPPAVLDKLAAGTDLLATWWPFAMAVVVVAGLVVLTVRWRKRRRRAVLTVLGSVVVAVACVGLGVNAWSGYAPSLNGALRLITSHGTAATATTGALTPVNIPTPKGLNMPDSTTWIYTPPGYDAASAARYPTLVMIHGSPGMSVDWSVGGDLAHTMDVLIGEGLIQPMIVVMPEINGYWSDQMDTECLNSTLGGPQVETYLTDVVVPWVDAHYATAATWQSRAVGGMSAGGFCGVDQGLRHPELYGAIISIEGYDNPGSSGSAALSTHAAFLAHSPGVYVDTMTFEHPVAAFFGTSGNSAADERSATEMLAGNFEARGQAVDYRDVPNEYHTWHTARALLPYALVFISEHLKAGGGAS